MLTHEKAQSLRHVAQNILTSGQPFAELEPQIEAFATVPDELERTRICKIPVGAPIGHLVACHIMTRIEEGFEPIPLEAETTVYDRYMTLTESVDRLAAQEIVDKLKSSEGTHAAALAYYIAQTDSYLRFADTNKDIVARRGKQQLDPSVTAESSMVGQFAENSRFTIPSLMVREVVRIRLATGVLPPSEALAGHLKDNMRLLTDQSTLPGPVFLNSQLGRELSQLRIKQLREAHDSELNSATWIKVLNQVVSKGTLPDITKQLVMGLERGSVAYPTSLLKGYCPAQFLFRSYEPDGRECNKERATNYFARHGIHLTDGRFRTADYQFLRSLEAAEVTFLADPDYRAALEMIATALGERTHYEQ